MKGGGVKRLITESNTLYVTCWMSKRTVMMVT